MRRLTLLALTLLLWHTPARALTVSGTAPAFADSGGGCATPILVPRSGPMVMVVQIEGPAPLTTIVRKDSLTINMNSPWSIAFPNPVAPGLYKIRAYGRRALSGYGCADSTMFVLDTLPPVHPPIIAR